MTIGPTSVPAPSLKKLAHGPPVGRTCHRVRRVGLRPVAQRCEQGNPVTPVRKEFPLPLPCTGRRFDDAAKSLPVQSGTRRVVASGELEASGPCDQLVEAGFEVVEGVGERGELLYGIDLLRWFAAL